MKRGSIYWVNLEPSIKPELGKTRPCLVVSNTEQNHRLSTLIIVPLSSQAPEIWPLRIEISSSSLKKKSYAVIPGMRQVSKWRMHEFIETISLDVLENVDSAISNYLKD
ncbi:MAG: type II toxin-antitoxin system PemK/MazF family toxin [Deltaproteobacteria bacterium]|nr:type II toxin-antitoxin system PemK/MazF family toxin [Deltaproteobacteria bacterium]